MLCVAAEMVGGANPGEGGLLWGVFLGDIFGGGSSWEDLREQGAGFFCYEERMRERGVRKQREKERVPCLLA